MSKRNKSLLTEKVTSNAPNPQLMKLLEEQAIRIKQTQFNQHGLIIIQALYGDLVEIGEQPVRLDYNPGNCIDITMQLQAAVNPQDETLIVHCSWDEPLHTLVEGLWNPNESCRSRLVSNRVYIQYVFQNQYHWLLQESTDPLILPLEDHHEEQHVEYDQTADLTNCEPEYIPQCDLDVDENGDFFWDLSQLWDINHQYAYNNSQYLFLKNHRPLGFFVIPRTVAVTRAIAVRDLQEKRRVLTILGSTVLLSTAISAAHFLGFIDLGSYPILSLFFSKRTPAISSSSSTTTTTNTPTSDADNNI